MTALIKIYMKKIEKGELSLEEIPIRWRAEVEAELEKMNNKE